MKKSVHTILLLAPQPFYEDRGTPIATRLVINALTDSGHKVDLLTFPIGRSIQKDGLTIYRTIRIPWVQSIPIGFSIKKLSLDLFLFFSMWRKVLTRNYDCIFAIEESAFLALTVKALTGLPVIYDMQSCMTEQLAQTHRVFKVKPVKALCQLLENKLLRNVNTVICSYGLKSFISRLAPDTPAYEWIYPGMPINTKAAISDQIKSEFDITENRPIIIYTGNSEGYQGMDLLLESAELVLTERPDAVFLLVGVDLNTIKSMATQNILRLIDQKKIQCITRQNRERTSSFLSHAYIAVSPRKGFANLPLKIFDYLQHGLPMIVTDIPTHRQLLNESIAKFVGSTSTEMATGILHLLSDSQQVEQLRTKSLEYAAKNLTFTSFQERLTEIVQVTINDRRNGG
jgi:glycosyltransferase involved in cell wall biosynthesis